MIVLEAKNIQKHFGGVTALSNGNLQCKKGRITGLLGANGSGKSTLSKIIAGVYKADAGEIRYQGRVVRYRNPYEARRDGIALVFQNLSLVPDLTVWQNITLGMESNKGLFLDNQSAKELSKNILDQLLPGLDINKKVYKLNPGEMQIVEIAKAISENPKLLILDEPTAALEQAQVKNLFQYIRTLARKGVAMIFTSHRLWEVMEICDDVTIFRNGEDVATIDFDKEEKDPEKIVSYITGETRKSTFQVNHSDILDETLLRVHITGKDKLLREVSFDLKKGEILGIGGLAGQGQQELLYALSGSYPGVKCEIELNGKKIRLNRPSDAIANGILLVPGDRQREGLSLEHSIYSNMIFPKIGLRRHSLFIPERRYCQNCEEIVKILSIKTPSIDVPVNNLSGGNQQKVVVGKWLSFDVQVFLLSDPAKGVDVGAKRDLYEYIVKLAKEKKIGVILYASDNEELIEYADRILIMYEGRIVATLTGEEINDDNITATSLRVR
ncbi:MAG: sugar ABC transporter ATP-binding protein [Candidatus Caldatribacteriaceae bacterium]